MRRLNAAQHTKVMDALLESNASAIVGGCLVELCGGFMRLERLAEPYILQSEWDFARQCAPNYAGAMADLAREVLKGRRGPQRVLLLGLGGGTIAGSLILIGAGRPVDRRIQVAQGHAGVEESTRAPLTSSRSHGYGNGHNHSHIPAVW